MNRYLPKYSFQFLRYLAPDYIIDSVSDIAKEDLPKEAKALAFDADSTIVEHGAVHINPEIVTHLQEINLPLHIATNRLERKATDVARLIDADSVTFATKYYRKPQQAYFHKLAANAGVPAEQIVMTGDRLFTDIFGANKARMTTVYVKAYGRDPWYMKYTGIRMLENALVRALTRPTL